MKTRTSLVKVGRLLMALLLARAAGMPNFAAVHIASHCLLTEMPFIAFCSQVWSEVAEHQRRIRQSCHYPVGGAVCACCRNFGVEINLFALSQQADVAKRRNATGSWWTSGNLHDQVRSNPEWEISAYLVPGTDMGLITLCPTTTPQSCAVPSLRLQATLPLAAQQTRAKKSEPQEPPHCLDVEEETLSGRN